MIQPDAPAVPADEPVRIRPRRRLRWLAAAMAVLLLGLASAWWLFWSGPVVSEGGFGLTVHAVEPGDPYLVTVETLCLDGAATAVVEDVTVDRAGLTVTDFAVRPRPGPPSLGFGSGAQRALADSGFGDARSFSAQCGDEAYAELAVELSRGAIGPAHTETVAVHWRAGLRSGVLSVPLSLTGDATELCTGGA